MSAVFQRGRAIVPFVFLLALLPGPSRDPEDWAASPEAYFLTSDERAEWRTLDSRDSRHDFIERYWLKRDPSPGTERNQFREMVLARIKTADARFGIEHTPGSRTARGLVFIVLGSPARVQDQNAPPPPPEAGVTRRLGAMATPVASVEGNETTSTWFYEPDRTRRILEVLHRPSLQIKIVVEPSRHLDSIQDPGLFDELREVVARASIVNPDLVPPPGPGSSSRRAAPSLPLEPLAPAIRQILESAPPAARTRDAFVGSAVVFRDRGEPETIVWAFTPQAPKRASLHVLVRTGESRDVATVTEPAEVSSEFSTRTPGMVAVRRLPLPPGSYSASVALTDEAGKPFAAASTPIQVPSLEKGFAVSSLIITRGPATGGAQSSPFFTFAGTALPPRADGLFGPTESLWYFVEVANPADKDRVLLEPRLRRGGEPLAGSPALPANLQPIGSGRYIAGVEMPLSTLVPGDYVLYLTVSDGESEGRSQVLRRADFQVVR
jgi:GWxTD domain-containing protein